MRVAYVLGMFPSLSETFILREIEALVAEGVDVRIYSLWPPETGITHPAAKAMADRVFYAPDRRLGHLLSACLRSPRLVIHGVRQTAGANGAPFTRVLRALGTCAQALDVAAQARRDGIDHLHAHFAFEPTDVASLAAHWLHLPFSVSVHAKDIYTQSGPALFRRLRGAVFVAACTRHGRDHLMRKCPVLSPDRIALIRHGLQVEDLSPEKRGSGSILAVGRLEQKKGFRYLVDACRILKQRQTRFRCTIVGAGPEERDLRERIAAHALTDVIELAGPRDQVQLRDLYHRADLLVLPSVVTETGDRDGLPNVLLEAASHALPLVSTRVGGIPEFVEDGVHGFLVASRDSEALADRIENLLGDADARMRMGLAGRERVAREFDISRNVEELIALLKGQTRTSA